MKYKASDILKTDDYKDLFSKLSDDQKKYALEHALDTRKFEIELYWKRATYFWTFIAFTFGGYFALAIAEFEKVPEKPQFLFILSCVGLVFSFGWLLANRGSKFWQENWEKHVDMLENEVFGPLHKTILHSKSFSVYNIIGPFKFSVTKINQVLSIFITIIWLFLCIQSYSTIVGLSEPWKDFNLHFISLTSFIAIIGMILTQFSKRTSFYFKTHEVQND